MLLIDGESLTVSQVVSVARGYEKVSFSKSARDAVAASRAYIDKKLDGQTVIYGVTTGFGKMADTPISPEHAMDLQRNLIRSHACGMGDPIPEDTVRAAMLLRCNALSRGYSGIRPETLDTLLSMLNAGVHPVIPEKGSLGASGDLAPLSHMALVMIGKGEAVYRGEKIPGGEAMRRAGIPPVVLAAKEGLALINGTQIMTALAALAVYDAMNLCDTADVAAAMSMQALLGITDALDERVHALRGHPGQITSALHLRRLLEGSALALQRQGSRVQDAYSLRCAPQVHGATRDAVCYAFETVTREINAVTDNPLIFADGDRVISGGNFHGQPIALAMDFLGIAVAELADISERRIERMVNPQLSEGLPAFLTEHSGVNSGFMIAQYAAASMVSENKVWAHPASVDSIPSSANQEDHVSMGTIAARKARMILDNTQKVLGIELLCAAQAIDFRGSQGLSAETKAVYKTIRDQTPFIPCDTELYPEMSKMDRLVKQGAFAL